MQLTSGLFELLELEKNLFPYKELLSGGLGEKVLNSLSPAANFFALKQREALLKEWLNYVDLNGEFKFNASVEPVSQLFQNAKHSGILSGLELLKVRQILLCAKKIRDSLENVNDLKNIDALKRNLRDFNPEIDALNVIEDSGRLSDTASANLSAIRNELENLKHNAKNIANKLFDNPNILNMLQEKNLLWRDNRFVVLVRQEHINKFPGLAIEKSASGNSVYIEPSALSRVNNNLILKSRDERDEEHRILAELTKMILSRENAIIIAENTIGTFDLLNACYELVRNKKFVIPELADKKFFRLVGARHPMLREKAVAIDTECGEKFSLLVITGANTGGKTVALKTVGVLIILAWLGLPIPARDGTVIGNFDQIFADIGDEQSIEQSLSTFGAHLKKTIYILQNATENSLILLDELGSGTDPYEGAALGVAILENLRQRGIITLATTHHNPVKQYALLTDGVEPAAMEFDINTLSPTYKLLMGVPGRSNAILIARRYGMPEEILNLAQKNLDAREVTSEDIMSELNERRAALDRAEENFKATVNEAEELKRIYQARVKEIDIQRDKIMEAADRRAERVISHAEATSKEYLKELDETMKIAARKNLFNKKKEFKKIRGEIDTRRDKRIGREIENSPKPFEVVPGVTAQIAGSGLVGLVEEVKNGRAYMIAGAMRVEVPVENLIATDKKARVANPPVDTTKAIARVENVPSSIMVRGMYVGEAMPLVENYLDKAYRTNHTSVMVIHGRGEGILRREVHALCSRLAYVKEFRLGTESEGGYGVTVITFKK